MKSKLLLAAAACVLAAGVINAQTSSGTLQLSGTVQASLSLEFHQDASDGIQLDSGAGSPVAAASLSTVAMYGTPNGLMSGTNFTKTQQSNGFTLTGVLNLLINVANITSPTYHLMAQLQSSDSLIWSVNANPINSTGQTEVATGGFYNTPTPTSLAVFFPNTIDSGAVGNTITFTAIPD